MLQGRLVNVLADRVREFTASEQQREKLAALGKISAGLAHELNNPAAAVRRAADNLRRVLRQVHSAALALDKRGLPNDARIYLAQLDCNWIREAGPQTALDTFERSDREEAFADWLEAHGVEQPWEMATALVDIGCTRQTLEEVAAKVPAEFLSDALTRLTASFTIARLAEEIEGSAGKISELVRAVKEYSYMDQMPEQEVDIHLGIENTLVMLRHSLKNNVEVVREYDRTLPPICARGSELNQVWTNLISNAVDAMKGSGQLRIRTGRDLDNVLVEVIDNGPGIPKDIQSRIFDPFFTTKPVGEGTGLGLDAVQRIVRSHHGSVTVDSRPGETRFVVRIPLSKPAETNAGQSAAVTQ
ncbi:MAG: hypothetical protein JOZ43_09285 [Acidobacteriales bacterium]|nr:hypothetical protein [Terriglobales bacterium]